MALVNRCPSCGGVANHLVTDIGGRPYYKCMTGLTSFRKEYTETDKGVKTMQLGNSHIIPCGTTINDKGQLVDGTIAYRNMDFNKRGKLIETVRTLSFTDGKERR